MRLPTLLALALCLVSYDATATELVDLRGNEPLRANLNQGKETDRILFIGAPT